MGESDCNVTINSEHLSCFFTVVLNNAKIQHSPPPPFPAPLKKNCLERFAPIAAT